MSLIELDNEYVANTYGRFPIEIEKGKGSILYDKCGKEYIDLGSGIGVNAFGLCDEEWKNAVVSQINKVQHVSNLYYTEPCAKLAELLCKKTGMKKVFFSNSGAEANECAIKVARKYALEHKGKDYYNIITLKNGFHGRTITTLSATGQDCFHNSFSPFTEGFLYADTNDIYQLEAIVSMHKVGAIMIECIQGEGGVNTLDAEYIEQLKEFIKFHDLLLIVDEVQTGNGRTGKFYSYMNFGLTPDIVTTAKGLGGGLPIGACLMGEKVQNTLKKGDHGSTFGGNPVACAGAISIVKRIDDILPEVIEKSKFVFNELKDEKGIESVSGLGLMIGIKTVKPASEVLNACIKRGVLCLTAKNKLRLLPALNIPFDLLKTAIQIIKEECAR